MEDILASFELLELREQKLVLTAFLYQMHEVTPIAWPCTRIGVWVLSKTRYLDTLSQSALYSEMCQVVNKQIPQAPVGIMSLLELFDI